jgi:hypothetical protein
VLSHSEVDSLLKKHEAAEEASKKEKEQKSWTQTQDSSEGHS